MKPIKSNQKLTNQSIIQSIIKFTSLDQETVSSQLIPYLNSLKTKLEIQDYLKSLLGHGLEEDEFIKQVILSKFKSEVIRENQKQHQLDFPTLKSTSDTSTRSNLIEIKHQTQHTLPDSNPIFPNHSIQTSKDEDLSSKFGRHGNVYLKDKGKEPIRSKVNKKPTHEKESLMKDVQFTSNSQISSDMIEPKQPEEKLTVSETTLDPKSRRSTSISDLTIPLSKSILRELVELERIITSLQTDEPDSKLNLKTRSCFCSGEFHGLPLSPLPKICTSCGMIYCKLKLPHFTCPSCLRLDESLIKSNFKQSILSHFELKMEDLILIQLDQFQTLQKRLQVLNSNELKRQKEFPDLGFHSNSNSNSNLKSLNEFHRFNQTSYVNQLTGGKSIEDRIQEGYQTLQQSSKDPHPISNSHTVLRLDSKKSGPTQLIKTTKSIKHQRKSQSEVQEENLRKIKEIEDELNQMKSLDELDDGYRISSGLEALFVIPFGHFRARTVKVIEYIPVSNYQHDV
ncbi:hypothetical protein DFH28DRAFT_945015 [Melampsora americana]|nr:hypothetical protein DFH28DRAFT_945015 [Melampsora americana]